MDTNNWNTTDIEKNTLTQEQMLADADEMLAAFAEDYRRMAE